MRARRSSSTTEKLCRAFACLFAMMAIGLSPVAAETRAQRIVSLNLCTDVLLVDLVTPERIRALSFGASDPRISTVAAKVQADRFKLIRGEAEEVLALDPDLILTAMHTSAATVSLLERLGRRVVKIPMAQDIAGVRIAIKMVANATGDIEKGGATVAAFDARLAKLNASSAIGPAPTVVIYQINALVSGPGTLEAEAMRLAGFRNLAPLLNPDRGGRVSLEAIVAHPPDLLVLSGPSDEYRTVVADSLTHPALAATMKSRATMVLPWRQWICGSPSIADAIEALVDARRRIAPRRPPA